MKSSSSCEIRASGVNIKITIIYRTGLKSSSTKSVIPAEFRANDLKLYCRAGLQSSFDMKYLY
ncbi:hypothetical protein ASE21_07200 [Flavobacterium sp. Root901]|nr:hypothetical protein ASE21_07200 [Flavobacterium sp. Root901]